MKPNGLLGAAYMAAIKPLRYLMVYPALMRQIGRVWDARVTPLVSTAVVDDGPARTARQRPVGRAGVRAVVAGGRPPDRRNVMLTIDVWMQHPTLRFMRHDMFEPLRRWMGVEVPDEELPIALTIAAMDGAGVDIGLLSSWHGPTGELISNEEVAGWVQAHPDRFRGLASVDLRDPIAATRELRRCVTDLGFVGLRVVPWLWELPPNHRYYYPLYAVCVELGVPFCTQVGHTGPLRTSETGRPIPYLDDVALDFPDLVIVAGHIGYPWTQEMIAVARKHPNIHIDSSAYTSRRYPPELVDYMKADGAHKVLFATNYPMIIPERALEDLDALGLDEQAIGLFLGGNAQRLFDLRD